MGTSHAVNVVRNMRESDAGLSLSLPSLRVALISAAALVGTAVGLMVAAYLLRVYHLVRRSAAACPMCAARAWNNETKVHQCRIVSF